MTVLKIILFAAVTWVGVLMVFKYSTYHRYFWRALPILVTFAGLDGYMYDQLGFGHYWITFLVIFFIAMLLLSRRQVRDMGAIMQLTNNPEELRFVARSFSQTLIFFWLSVLVFIVAWFVGLLISVNR